MEIGLNGEEDNIVLSLVSGFLPEKIMESIEIPYGNEVVYAASRARWSQGDIVLRDWVDRPTLQLLLDWHNSVHNPETGAVGAASFYKRDASIIVFPHNTLDNTDRGSVSERVWTLQGAYPERLNPAVNGLSMPDANQVMIGLTIRYDKAIASGARAPNYGTDVTGEPL